MGHALESDILLVNMRLIDRNDERLLNDLRVACVWGHNPPVIDLLIRISYITHDTFTVL